jgi:hypothetical protein
LSPTEIKVVDALFSSLVKMDRFDISREAKRRIGETLGESYRTVLARYGISQLEPEPELDEPPQRPFLGEPTLHRLFSAEAEKFVVDLASRLDG